ncbi:MAG: hypothetical protein JW741_27620, partial [Sedimentisphaerales bacterium]|nr:hypothetical protein [Sedimentisphaerales bacterium]
MIAHVVEHRGRIRSLAGSTRGFGRWIPLLLLALAVPATAQERSRQIAEMEAGIADLQTNVAALE